MEDKKAQNTKSKTKEAGEFKSLATPPAKVFHTACQLFSLERNRTMTRGDYEVNRQRIISAKRSLIMQVRQWQNRRPGYAAKLQAKLNLIITPPPLPKVYGYELIDSDGNYAGFTLDENEAIESSLKYKKREANITSNLPV